MISKLFESSVIFSILVYIVVAGITESSGEEESPVEKFVATSTWQRVRKGQAIPRGLHVRMNINTGETEAKLLDSEDVQPSTIKSRTDLVEVPPSERNWNIHEEGEVQAPYMTKEELQAFLSKATVSEEEYENQDDEEKKKQFRSYEDIKKEFKDINLAVKTEIELLAELVASGREKLAQLNETEAIVNILTDLEYLVHQIDNAQEFIRIGGLSAMILPALNSSVPRIRAEALWLLGSASQSNPKVQIAVLNAGIIQKILRAAALDDHDTVRARAIYALSCLTRRFPSAQAKLVEEGGLAIIGSMFDSEHATDSKVKMKVLTLINDFILERQDVKKEIEELSLETQSSNSFTDIESKMRRSKLSELKEKLRQYEGIHLEKILEEDGWCSRLPKFLYKLQINEANADRSKKRNDLGSVISDNLPYRPEHDDVEKVLNSILTMNDICFDTFKNSRHLEHTLRQLLSWYEELSSREEIVQKQAVQECYEDCSGNNGHLQSSGHDLYYSNMAQTLIHILRTWNKTSKTDDFLKRDEL